MGTRIIFFQRIMHFINAGLERSAYQRTRRHLLRLNDRILEDMGFSRELLERGQKAWPWRMPEETYAGDPVHPARLRHQTA